MKRLFLSLIVLCSTLALATPVTISISPTTATVYSGATQQFIVTTNSKNGVFCSATAGSVNGSGLFTAPIVAAKTTVTISCKAVNTSKTAKATVTVLPLPAALATIKLSPASATVIVGGTQQFAATGYDQYGHVFNASFTFQSTNYAVAGIDSTSGLATGYAVGKAGVSAYSGSVMSNTATLTVNPVPPPSTLAVKRLSPNFGLISMSGDFNALTIVGTGFQTGATVNFGANVLTPSSVTTTAVTVTIPVAEFGTVRSVPVTVTNPDGTKSASLSFNIIDSGFVSLTFDDGYASAYNNGIPLLDAAGIKSTFYTITSLVGTSGYVTKAQLQTLNTNGHEIGNHTRTHPYLSTVSATQLTNETSGAEGDFPALLNVPAPQTFAYPYDDYGSGYQSNVVLAVKAAGVRGARDSDYGGYNNTTSYPLLLDSMPSEADLQTDNIATVTGWIQQAMANKMWVIILWHRVDETGNAINVPSTVIQGVVSYIQQNHVPTATDSEGLVIENMDARLLP